MTAMSELYKNAKVSYTTDYFKDLKPRTELDGEVQRPGYTLKLTPNTTEATFLVVDADNDRHSILVYGNNGHFASDASFELTFDKPTNYIALQCFSSSWDYSRVVIYDKDGNPLHHAPVNFDTTVKYFGPGIHRAVYEGPVEEFELSLNLVSVTHGLGRLKNV
ncbi:hypothetical protein [Pseudomonas sp. REB1044]|uniref:hypothetical protein n=1 Tax=Pseudomonas sp. REB1044 TaxID=2675224 RepID=UPI00315C7222